MHTFQNTRRSVEIKTVHDDIIGATKTIYFRARQPINKDGRDSKRKAWRTGAQLVVFADGGYRYYGSNGILARENVTDAYVRAELAAPDMDEDWYFDA